MHHEIGYTTTLSRYEEMGAHQKGSRFWFFLSGVIVTSLVHYLGSIYSFFPTEQRNNQHLALDSTSLPRRAIVFGDSITQFGYEIETINLRHLTPITSHSQICNQQSCRVLS
jgi:hypothetical protein